MRTGRTLTVFRKLETPPKIWSRHPPENLEQAHPPPKIWSRHTPPENLEQAPLRKFGAGTPPCGQTHACENITLAKTSFRPVNMKELDFQGMDKIREEFMVNEFHKDRNCFMLCILAHGCGDYIYTKKEKVKEGEKWVWKNCKRAWNIQEIQDELDVVPSLLGKPKLLLIDACRGGEL